MKSIKEIENMSLEQLEAVSMDEGIVVPEGFESQLREDFGTLERLTSDDAEYGLKVRTVRIIFVAAASVAVIAGIGLGIAGWQDEPKDTYNDPYLAYAELEKAFEMISTGINKSMDMANSVISEK